MEPTIMQPPMRPVGGTVFVKLTIRHTGIIDETSRLAKQVGDLTLISRLCWPFVLC
jgi:hypothetical protein